MPVAYLKETASQTAGPYVHLGLLPGQAGLARLSNSFGRVVAGDGERIRIEGRVFDGLGQVVRDALIEIWQASAAGRYDEPGFRGWARTETDPSTGLYSFDTVRPGAAAARHGGLMAPHVNVWIVSRGLNIGLATRMYFADEASNASDAVLGIIDPAVRRQTLLAERSDRDGVAVYTFDIRLQGEHETVFFDI